MKKKVSILLILILISLMFLFILYKQHHEATSSILGYGTIEAREIHVGSRIGGRVLKVLVKESDIVDKDTILVTLESEELKAQEKQAQAALRAAQAAEQQLIAGYRKELKAKSKSKVEEQRQYLNKIKKGPRKEEIDAQKALVKSAKSKYNHAKKEFQRILTEGKNSSQREKDNALRTLEMANAQLNAETKKYQLLMSGSTSEEIAMAIQRLAQAKAEFNRLKAGPRKEEKDKAKANKEEIQAKLELIKVQLKECKIKSPIKGRVEICNLEPGDILAPGQTAVTLLKPYDLWVKIYIKEYELHRVSIGEKVDVIIEINTRAAERSIAKRIMSSFITEEPKEVTFKGKIIHIASQAEFTPRNVQTKEARSNQVFAVKVAILNPEKTLRPGMSVTVKEK